MRQVVCSICGQELGFCRHEKGQRYNGEVCHGILTGAKDAYEWSFVAVPAQREAGVVKSKRYGGADGEPQAHGDVQALRLAKARLELEKIRYGGN